jgi:hypothetical protein
MAGDRVTGQSGRMMLSRSDRSGVMILTFRAVSTARLSSSNPVL